MKFNYLTIIGEPKNGKVLCRCDCGNEKYIRTSNVKNGRTKSCGCFNRRAASERMSKYNQKYTIDVDFNHPIYQSFKSMKTRFRNEVCDEWINNFEDFYNWAINNGWKNGLVLHRKDTNSPYSPANCYWGKRISNHDAEKARQTCVEKYGKEYYTQTHEYAEKSKTTCIKKYGVTHPAKSEDIQVKVKDTCLKKYGYENPLSAPQIKHKIRQTNINRYGNQYVGGLPQTQLKAKQTCIQKYGVPYVFTTNKGEESELSKWINQYGNFQSNHSILNGREIDLYDSAMQIGLEYCGIYWHNELSPEPRDKNYHYNKYVDCLKKNIRLITIFSDEWLYRKQQVKNYLLSVLNKNKILYARKCRGYKVGGNEAKTFIEQHHIQGCKRRPVVAFGLEYGGDLCGVISLDRHPRKNILVLNRMVFRGGYTIVGGASKIFKQVIDWCKKEGIEQIITWSDNRWSQGNIYYKLGFELDGELGPDYSYVNMKNSKIRIPKQKMKKSSTGCPKNLTERQWCINNGFGRIWDCGKKRFVFII
jgi:hypothetical protein